MLDLINVSKVFNKNTIDENVVIDKLNLHVNEGDFITVVGSNGAGKSTLFNLISGYHLPDEGAILLDGKDITYVKEHIRSKQIGRLFQDTKLGTCPDLTVLENLGLAYLQSRNRGLFSYLTKKDIEEIKSMLSLLEMGLEDRLNTPIGLLSGGQRQAVTLLMATMSKPRLLLLDEHTAALDPKTAEKVLSLTCDIVEKYKITTLMITHNMKDALSLGNRTIVMNEGSVALDLKGEERSNCTIEELLTKFRKTTGKDLDDDRIILRK